MIVALRRNKSGSYSRVTFRRKWQTAATRPAAHYSRSACVELVTKTPHDLISYVLRVKLGGSQWHYIKTTNNV